MKTLLLSLIASVGLVGCVGGLEEQPQTEPQLPEEDNPGNNPGNNPAQTDLSAAKALYDGNVFPIMSAKCSGGSCHTETGQVSSPIRFVAADPAKAWQTATSFTALVGNFTVDSAPVLTKVAAGHYGVTYAAPETQAITDWLNKEVELRNTIGGGGSGSGSGTPTGESLSQATNRVLSEFRGCMTIGDFQAANMAQAWGAMKTQNNQECDNCHSTGGEGFVASRDESFFWTVFSNQKYYFLQYLTVSLINGPAAAEVIVNTVSFRGVANGQDPHREHPRFNATDNQGMQALNQFYNAVKARKTANGCMAPSPFPMN
jgi:hypothetical protein